ncbi:MAG: glycosyltransferase [Verrucomicrobiota bacterium]
MRLLIIGVSGPTHVGRHFLNAAGVLGWEAEVLDSREAFQGPAWWRRVCWHLLGRRPPALEGFSRMAVTRCQQFKPDLVLATGITPLNAESLRQLRHAGIPAVNFLTDDPWNPAHRAHWFLRALPNYRHVFNPRHACEMDLRGVMGESTSWLPFAYAPADHFPPPDLSEDGRDRWGHLVAFIGGADADRVKYARALAAAKVPLGLWGGYWKDHPDLATHAHGHADAETCRHIVAGAGANLCLVRRANRDGHSMRSYELPAIGGCLLVEDTEDHRRLFGEEGNAASYFTDTNTLTSQARRLLSLPFSERSRMAAAAHHRVVNSGSTYACRLKTIFQTLLSETGMQS